MNRLKLENVRPAVKDASVPREEMAMTLDAALVDAPCSGTGVMNEKPDVKYRVTEEGVQALCRTQKDILDAVAPMVKVGGTLVYSTCSILPQENEAQIKAFLERHPEYEVWPMGAELPEKLAAHENACGLQMFAHRDGTDGFYVCRMRRVVGVMSGMDKTQLAGHDAGRADGLFQTTGPASLPRQAGVCAGRIRARTLSR